MPRRAGSAPSRLMKKDAACAPRLASSRASSWRAMRKPRQASPRAIACFIRNSAMAASCASTATSSPSTSTRRARSACSTASSIGRAEAAGACRLAVRFALGQCQAFGFPEHHIVAPVPAGFGHYRGAACAPLAPLGEPDAQLAGADAPLPGIGFGQEFGEKRAVAPRRDADDETALHDRLEAPRKQLLKIARRQLLAGLRAGRGQKAEKRQKRRLRRGAQQRNDMTRHGTLSSLAFFEAYMQEIVNHHCFWA